MKNRPNIFLISVDHWPAAMLGSAGHEVIMTPTLDSMARNGVRFTNAYSECPVCIPSRRSLMTGTTPKSHGDRIFIDTLEMPKIQTLAGCFGDAGYQTFAVGKMHVYPQRNRIGFDDVILAEEGRYEFGVVDDYQIWLGEKGYTGQEFLHAMGSNAYVARTWHLPEETHPTSWATREMAKVIKRKDPTRPAFYYLSYQFPHPPLVPLSNYYNMYNNEEIDSPLRGDWNEDDVFLLKSLREKRNHYPPKQIQIAKRAFYAQCTHIDHQIRLLIGTLREQSLLDNTIIVFLSDHGDMLFDHGIVAKRNFYEGSANIPLIFTGKPIEEYRNQVDSKLVCLADIMPTLLSLCDIPIPDSVEGISAFSGDNRAYLYGEVGESDNATRMIHDGRFKLIYYAAGNYLQLFDLSNDPKEKKNLAGLKEYAQIEDGLVEQLIQNLYGSDEEFVKDSSLIGREYKEFSPKPDYNLYNQRGSHWPPPSGYKNVGLNL